MYLVLPLLSNPVSTLVRNIVEQPENTIGVDPAVRAGHRAVRMPLLPAKLAIQSLEPEVARRSLIGLDVILLRLGLDAARHNQWRSLSREGQGHQREKAKL